MNIAKYKIGDCEFSIKLPIPFKILKSVMPLLTKEEPDALSAGEMLINACAVENEVLKSIKADGSLMAGACFKVIELIEFKEAERIVKKK